MRQNARHKQITERTNGFEGTLQLNNRRTY